MQLLHYKYNFIILLQPRTSVLMAAQNLTTKSCSVTTQMKPGQQYLHKVVF